MGDLLGNTIIIQCPNSAAKNMKVYLQSGSKLLPCTLRREKTETEEITLVEQLSFI